MIVSVILAHPNKASFNHAIAQTALDVLGRNRHAVAFHDLYEEGFDPILTQDEIPTRAILPPVLTNHCSEISSADGIIIVHPNWWGQPPAILKGWVDRVFRPDVAYRFLEGDKGEGIPVGLLKARAALVFNTSNTAAGRELSVFGDPIETLWRNCIFGLCGVGAFYRTTFSVVVNSTVEQRRQWLKEVEETVSRYFPGE
jgi:NAD(P)H dehydrogenase (quinone)